MKKLILSTALALVLSNSLKSQDHKEVRQDVRTMEIGIRYMPTFSAFKITNSNGSVVSSQVTLGYGIGGMLGVNFTKNVGMQVEVIYNSLSQKFKDQNYNRQINVKYVNVPLMLSLNTDKSKALNFNMVIGPQMGVNVGSSVTSSGGANDTFVTAFSVRKSDFGIAYGAGLEFMLNPAHTFRLGVGYRGVSGFVNISEAVANSGNTYTIQKANVRTNSAYLGIAFLF